MKPFTQTFLSDDADFQALLQTARGAFSFCTDADGCLGQLTALPIRTNADDKAGWVRKAAIAVRWDETIRAFRFDYISFVY